MPPLPLERCPKHSVISLLSVLGCVRRSVRVCESDSVRPTENLVITLWGSKVMVTAGGDITVDDSPSSSTAPSSVIELDLILF